MGKFIFAHKQVWKSVVFDTKPNITVYEDGDRETSSASLKYGKMQKSTNRFFSKEHDR